MSFRDFFRADKQLGGGNGPPVPGAATFPTTTDPPPPTSLIAVPTKRMGRSRSQNVSKANGSTARALEVRPHPTAATTTPTSYTPHALYGTPSPYLSQAGTAARVSSLPPKIMTKSGNNNGGGSNLNGGASSGGSVLVLHGKVHNYVSDSSSVSMASSNGSEDSLEKVMGHHQVVGVVPNHKQALVQPSPMESRQPTSTASSMWGLASSRSRSLPPSAPASANAVTNYYPPVPLLHTATASPSSHQLLQSGGAMISSTTSVAAVSASMQQLMYELQQFQALIGDLQGMMMLQSHDSSNMSAPEAGWRTRILVRSAQEADNDLWRKLYEMEQVVLAMKNDADMAHANDDNGIGMEKRHRTLAIQEAQAKCLELHRHFKHLHKTLLCTLEAHEQSQRAAMAQQLHTAAVLMMNPATSHSPSVLLTPTPTRDVLPNHPMMAAAYSPHHNTLSPPLSPTPYGGMMMMASPPMSPASSSHAFTAPVMMTSPLGPPPPPQQQQHQQQQPPMDYFDRVTRQAELERSSSAVPYGVPPFLAASAAPPTATTGVDANANGNPSGVVEDSPPPPGVWASRHCTEDGPVSAWGRYVQRTVPGLCGSLESLGDPREWNFGGIEALDLVYKGSDMELSKGSAANRPQAAVANGTDSADKDHESVEMISPASEAIEVERILTEEKDVVLGVSASGSSSGGAFVSRVPSIVKSFTDASMGTALPSVAPVSCGPGGTCSAGACAGGEGEGGKFIGCIDRRSGPAEAQDEEEVGVENGTNRAMNCGAFQGVALDEIKSNLVQFGRDVMSSVGDAARGDDDDDNGGRGRTRRGDTDNDEYDGDYDNDDHEEEDDDDDDSHEA